MGIGLSLVLIAVGAVLKWGVNVHTNGVDWNTIGVILLVVGLVGLVWSLVVLGVWRDDDRHHHW